MVALITGATSGIGYEFALNYAKNNYDLILVARNQKRLNEIKIDFENKYNINVKIFCIDLSLASASKNLVEDLKNIKVDILINNAGIGEYGTFINSDIEKLTAMINLNITTLTELTHHFSNHMLQNGTGKILNIASIASFQAVPTFAVYAATKAYVLNFSEAINYELRYTGVKVSTLCPGPTSSNFHIHSNATDSKHLTQGTLSAQEVAKVGIEQLENNKMTEVVGLKNKLLAFASSINPFRKLALIISASIMR